MSTSDQPANLATLRRRRGIPKASITRLTTKLNELEAQSHEPSTVNLARRMPQRLDSLDAEFKKHHYALIDAIEEADEETLSKEQDELDQHDDLITDLSMRIEKLITTCNLNSDSGARKMASRRLTHLKSNLAGVEAAVRSLKTDTAEIHVLHQYQEQLSDFKGELAEIRQTLLSLGLVEGDELETSMNTLDKAMFDCGLELKRLIYTSTPTRSSEPTVVDKTPPASKGVKLPKIDVPTFDGNILNWQTFWEQFSIAIHDRTNLSDTEKLVYLRHSLKDGTAKKVIEGLSQSGDQYDEAITCLKSRYDRPRLIHQTHVKKVVEITPLKEGSGKELRFLHDAAQQHLRALKAMGQEPSGSFITSLLELKLDQNTMFEWQKFSHDSTKMPHYNDLLRFIDLRAQASETISPETRKSTRSDYNQPRRTLPAKPVASFTANATGDNCCLCRNEKHPLYACSKFKALPLDKMVSTLKTYELCLNCLRSGHFSKQCPSANRCRKCQRPHHTLIHDESKERPITRPPNESDRSAPVVRTTAPSHTAYGITSNTLLMTCQVQIKAPDGSLVNARALLDSASSVSFISERMTQGLCLPRSRHNIQVSGVAGLSHQSPLQSVATFNIHTSSKNISVSAIVVPRVTCDLPTQPVQFSSSWTHLNDLKLADPNFGQPGRIDVLLGVDVYTDALLHGRRSGPPDSPVAFETIFGWVLAGRVDPLISSQISATSCHVSATSGDDILRRFWEIEENPKDPSTMSPEERSVVLHFKDNHRRSANGRFIVPLPKRPQYKPLGESRSQAVRRFLSLEKSLRSKGQFQEFSAVMEEYFDMKHAEPVPVEDLQKAPKEVFYLPMHAVRKEHSTTTKIRAVFDASAKSASGTSLNDLLLVGPTIHPPLIDVLLRFRYHRIALTADVSKMYRAISLVPPDRDLHRFVWRRSPDEPLQDYRMTRVTFGVSASSFAANMSLKQNALDFAIEYPQAKKAVEESFYVDDGLTGADSIQDAIKLQQQLQALFTKGGFLLRKWNSSELAVMKLIPDDLKDVNPTHQLPDTDHYTKTLGMEWNAKQDHFRLTVAELPPTTNITKRSLVSDIAKTYDVLGWFSPTIIKVKILLQQLWEQKVNWDDPVPQPIVEAWLQWRSELNLLTKKHVPRCYFDKATQISTMQLHGFSDASERAYAAVIYLRMTDSSNNVQTSLVISKTKVAPIKRLTIPRLELCGAYLLAQLLHHVRRVFQLPLNSVYAWTDSTIVLNWLVGNPRRFKTYVGNRISYISDLIGPERWNHVRGIENPADSASRGLFPSELLEHILWWDGPSWLQLSPDDWPKQASLPPNDAHEEEREVTLHTIAQSSTPLIPLEKYSNFNQLKRITAWILRFTQNCKPGVEKSLSPTLSTKELLDAESYWISLIQCDHFQNELSTLKKGNPLKGSSSLLSLHPILDTNNLLRVGGRQQNSKLSYSRQHPLILHGKHPITRLIIHTEHQRLLHAGPTLLTASLCRRYYITSCHKIVRSITRGCITCRRTSAKPQPQMLGQLPVERITPGSVFDQVGVDYAGPVYVKYGHVRKPTVVKAYICVFVSLSVKAVHLELVSDLTSDAFIAALRRFISRRGKPTLIWSDNGTNFVGAARELKELSDFLEARKTQNDISQFCSNQLIKWKFIPERTPHFGGLWEAAVKSMKTHLRRTIADHKLNFEELSTILSQIESCLNSRPLTPLLDNEDGIEALTPGHFLIGKPIEAIPDPAFSYRSLSLLRRWHLCQALTRHFWQRWSTEYISSLRRYTKWHHPTRNLQVGDVVVLQEDNLIPSKWSLAKITQVHAGKDGLVRVVTIKTASGTYKRPVTKIALLLPSDSSPDV